MKKLTAILLSAILVLALSACESNAGGSVTPNTDTQANTPVTNGIQTPELPIEVADPTTPTTPASPTPLTRDQAIDKALAAAGLTKADVRELEAELDRERGGLYWEVEFKSGIVEYDYDIHAETGEITRVERERD